MLVFGQKRTHLPERLYSLGAERQSCKLKVESSILSGGSSFVSFFSIFLPSVINTKHFF